MSFYDDASIVMIPSGYKASKLYCAKPTDGSGDLTFTRTGSTATRVNESGLIERCRTNLVLNSATLVTQNVTVVAAPYTLSFFGTGSVTLGGTGSGSLSGTGASNRVTLTFTPTAGTLSLTVSGSVTSAQLEIGDIATDYIPTTTAAVTVGPVANLPRLDYTGGGCPKLLMEPTRTNLIAYSQQFDNAAWTKLDSTIVKNISTSPDGYQNADRVVVTNGVGGGDCRQTFSYTTGTSYTLSIFVKKESSFNLIGFTIIGQAAVQYNIDTNAFTTLALLNGWTLSSTKYEEYGNSWKRVSVTLVAGTTGSYSTRLAEVRNTGDGTSGILFYGAQLEAGSYATSYIPTFNASVTRNADSASKTGISSLIGQTEGTLFADVKYIGLDTNGTIPFHLSNSSGSNQIYFIFLSDGKIRADFFFGFTMVASIETSSSFLTLNNRYKMAMSYKENDFVFYINGVQIGTDNNGIVSTTDTLRYAAANSGNFNNIIINQTLLFKTRLSNSDLATLTTL